MPLTRSLKHDSWDEIDNTICGNCWWRPDEGQVSTQECVHCNFKGIGEVPLMMKADVLKISKRVISQT